MWKTRGLESGLATVKFRIDRAKVTTRMERIVVAIKD